MGAAESGFFSLTLVRIAARPSFGAAGGAPPPSSSAPAAAAAATVSCSSGTGFGSAGALPGSELTTWSTTPRSCAACFRSFWKAWRGERSGGRMGRGAHGRGWGGPSCAAVRVCVERGGGGCSWAARLDRGAQRLRASEREEERGEDGHDRAWEGGAEEHAERVAAQLRGQQQDRHGEVDERPLREQRVAAAQVDRVLRDGVAEDDHVRERHGLLPHVEVHDKHEQRHVQPASADA